ncbi:MAG: glucose-1-phosphate adenylyltransferase subunit GlgD [Clostridia bacterium]|nr:glucose-1-phosphate adenylyltransferase subunit GlgD [Clostridia bacterium]MBR5991333.1 glucose-1-phosphate adenylyltransferase subunit GlgD [Clostridia bacterium]
MRASEVLGIIHAQNYSSLSQGELTSVRTAASVPYGGRYRMIDFPLSDMVNAGMTQVGIITNTSFQSLVDHVGSGRPWDLDRKREGMFILPPYNTSSALTNHDSKLSSLYSISDFLKKSRQDYVLLTDTNTLYNIDFKDLFKFHTEKNADITIVYKHGRTPNIQDLMLFAVGDDKRINEISVSSGSEAGMETNYSFNIILMRKSLLEYLVRSAVAHNATSFERDVIQANLQTLKIYGYPITGFSAYMDSLRSYYKANIDLLNPENRKLLFDPAKPVDTKICDNVPAMYGIDAEVKNSLIADGCVIEGTVENSVLFRDVKVQKGAVVRNSILMQGTVISTNSSLNAVITDKNAVVTPNKNLSGDESYPLFISKNSTV